MSGRQDDRPDLIKKRLAIYDREVEPVVEAYRTEGRLQEIDGEPGPEQVREKIDAALHKLGFLPSA